MKAKITGDSLIAQAKFLKLSQLFFTDDKGRKRSWESADRVNCAGAALIIARIVPDNEIILIRQFRPPAGRLMIEFPAGLIDEGETAEKTAVRELYEETGYRGRVTHVFAPGWSSPGLTGEAITMVCMEINGEEYQGKVPLSAQEDTESIETFRVKIPEIPQFLARQEAEGCGIDTKLYALCYALSLAGNGI